MMNQLLNSLPKMMTGNELDQALEILPEYDPEIKESSSAQRLIALQAIYQIYIPNTMSREIYSKLYLALVRSMQKKVSLQAVQQTQENYKQIKRQSFESILGGADSFTILGKSGIGKSSAVSRAVNLLMDTPIIQAENEYRKIIPVVYVQTPADCSVKGLLLEILRKIDVTINTTYYPSAIKAKATNDILIGSVSAACLNHVGLLIVDEIQNVVTHRAGTLLIGCLIQLINNSGISIGMVGTDESKRFFEQELMLARRSIGLHYHPFEYEKDFVDFCRSLFRYQYTKEPIEISDALYQWFYLHSGGVLSIVISLWHDAQEIAIINGTEKVDLPLLNQVYDKRMEMLRSFIHVDPIRMTPPKKRTLPDKFTNSEKVDAEQASPETQHHLQNSCPSGQEHIADLAIRAKKGGTNVLSLLKEANILIEEVAI